MSLFSALSIGASGMEAQRTRAEMLVENLANAETTRTPGGGPYRRKDVVFESASVTSPFSSVFDAQVNAVGGVAVSDIVTDTRDPERRYLPGIPTRTPTVMSRFRGSIRQKTWSISWARHEATRQMSRPSAP